MIQGTTPTHQFTIPMDASSVQLARDIMTPSYKMIAQDALLTDALAVMDKYNITTLAVTDSIDSKEIIGVISIHHIIDFK